MFGLGIAPKKIFLAYSTRVVFSKIRLATGNVIIAATDMCGKSPITGEQIYGITSKLVYFNTFVLFIVDTTSILKSVFPTAYCFCLDGNLGSCVVAIIVAVVFFYLFIYLFFVFIYLFIYLFFVVSTVILIFVVLGVIVAFCVWLLLLI